MNQTELKQTAIIPLHPTIFVILGITGDLASRKLLPALLALYSKKLLPQRFAIIGFSRRTFSREEFRELIRTKLNVRPGQFKEEEIKHFLDHMSYEQGMFDDGESYARLSKKLASIDAGWGQCSNKLFHLSVPPTLYENILSHIARSGLNKPCSDETGWTRILIEKPFGKDIAAARNLDKLLGKLFKEEQIFRIDHYLAKESLQNILAFRFHNSIFEPLWRREFIDKVHIKLYEKNTIEGRGAFYDGIGALRDVGQNHMLQMLALIAMDKPSVFDADHIRMGRAKILKHLVTITRRTLADRVTRAQYVGYTSESGVAQDSQTETYIRIQTHIQNPRWKGVPFFLETGKAMNEAKAEIDMYFKDATAPGQDNILTFRIQPDEGIKIKFFVKTPGYDFDVEPKTLKFRYSDTALLDEAPNDYERLIHDAFVGDQTLFASTQEIMASWEYVTPILEHLNELPLKTYKKGENGVI
ncbi:MAG: glucose-6-phosphate dehydrogenase [Candidatus Taylorbacteria bacterium]